MFLYDWGIADMSCVELLPFDANLCMDYSYNIVQCSDFKCFFMIGELQIGDLYRTDPLGLQLSVEYWCPQDNYGPHETTYNVRPPQRQVLVHLTHLKSKERKYTICLCIHVHFHCNGRKS